MVKKKRVPYVQGSATSKAAADSQGLKAQVDEARVLAHLQACGGIGATDDEVELALGMLHQTASARRRGLVLKDFVVNSGYTRATRTGCHATVWITAAVAATIEMAAIAAAEAAKASHQANCPHGEQRLKCILCRTRR